MLFRFINMPQRILFLILLFSSLHLTAQKSVIAATDTLTIRPKPPVLFKVNGKDGGLITESESMVWNFIYAGFGPGFTKDGIVFNPDIPSCRCDIMTGTPHTHGPFPWYNCSLQSI